LTRIAEEIVGLWQSDEVRIVRPQVLDEVKNGLFYFEATLYDLVPRLYRALERALVTYYPEHRWHVPELLRFGSWMGGDRDGNPYVTPDVTIETVKLMRAWALRRHTSSIEELSRRLGLSNRVRFAGYVPAVEVDAYYRSATLALFSSVWPEPFGLSGLEALRHGLPVVAFDVGGVREWLEDGVNGLLAPWMDTQAFAQRVDRLLGDPVLARNLGERGRELAAERFNFARYIDGLEELFGLLHPDVQVR
jgi:glycosyltransferase involved in cell wall biosynthesis